MIRGSIPTPQLARGVSDVPRDQMRLLLLRTLFKIRGAVHPLDPAESAVESPVLAFMGAVDGDKPVFLVHDLMQRFAGEIRLVFTLGELQKSRNGVHSRLGQFGEKFGGQLLLRSGSREVFRGIALDCASQSLNALDVADVATRKLLGCLKQVNVVLRFDVLQLPNCDVHQQKSHLVA
jgi:hypothetical protein